MESQLICLNPPVHNEADKTRLCGHLQRTLGDQLLTLKSVLDLVSHLTFVPGPGDWAGGGGCNGPL